MDNLEIYKRSDGYRIEVPLAHVVHIFKLEQAEELYASLGEAIRRVAKLEKEGK